LIAWSIASFVISWKTILDVFDILSQSWVATCRQIASHSRSSSVAIQTFLALEATDCSSLRVFSLSGETMYCGLKSFLISIAISFVGRSTMCHIDALTSYHAQRNFLIVCDLAGDSTITKLSIQLV